MRYWWGSTGDERRDAVLFRGLMTMLLGSYYGPHYAWALGAVVFFGAVFVWHPVVRALSRGRTWAADLTPGDWLADLALRERLSGVFDRSGGDGSEEDDPIAELRERYAAGDLNRAEFESRLEELLADETSPDDGASDAERELATETE